MELDRTTALSYFLRFLAESAGFSRVETREVDPVAAQPGRYSMIAWR